MAVKEISIDDFKLLKVEKNSLYVVSPKGDDVIPPRDAYTIATMLGDAVKELELNAEVVVLSKRIDLLTADQAREVLAHIDEWSNDV